jgi:hypothetical protein
MLETLRFLIRFSSEFNLSENKKQIKKGDRRDRPHLNHLLVETLQ